MPHFLEVIEIEHYCGGLCYLKLIQYVQKKCVQRLNLQVDLIDKQAEHLPFHTLSLSNKLG